MSSLLPHFFFGGPLAKTMPFAAQAQGPKQPPRTKAASAATGVRGPQKFVVPSKTAHEVLDPIHPISFGTGPPTLSQAKKFQKMKGPELFKSGTFMRALVEPERLTVDPLCGTLWNLNF